MRRNTASCLRFRSVMYVCVHSLTAFRTLLVLLASSRVDGQGAAAKSNFNTPRHGPSGLASPRVDGQGAAAKSILNYALPRAEWPPSRAEWPPPRAEWPPSRAERPCHGPSGLTLCPLPWLIQEPCRGSRRETATWEQLYPCLLALAAISIPCPPCLKGGIKGGIRGVENT